LATGLTQQARSSSVMARPWAACSSLKLGATSWHSGTAVRRATRAAALAMLLLEPENWREV